MSTVAWPAAVKSSYYCRTALILSREITETCRKGNMQQPHLSFGAVSKKSPNARLAARSAGGTGGSDTAAASATAALLRTSFGAAGACQSRVPPSLKHRHNSLQVMTDPAIAQHDERVEKVLLAPEQSRSAHRQLR